MRKWYVIYKTVIKTHYRVLRSVLFFALCINAVLDIACYLNKAQLIFAHFMLVRKCAYHRLDEMIKFYIKLENVVKFGREDELAIPTCIKDYRAEEKVRVEAD